MTKTADYVAYRTDVFPIALDATGSKIRLLAKLVRAEGHFLVCG